MTAISHLHFTTCAPSMRRAWRGEGVVSGMGTSLHVYKLVYSSPRSQAPPLRNEKLNLSTCVYTCTYEDFIVQDESYDVEAKKFFKMGFLLIPMEILCLWQYPHFCRHL